MGGQVRRNGASCSIGTGTQEEKETEVFAQLLFVELRKYHRESQSWEAGKRQRVQVTRHKKHIQGKAPRHVLLLPPCPSQSFSPLSFASPPAYSQCQQQSKGLSVSVTVQVKLEWSAWTKRLNKQTFFRPPLLLRVARLSTEACVRERSNARALKARAARPCCVASARCALFVCAAVTRYWEVRTGWSPTTGRPRRPPTSAPPIP